MLCIEIRLRNEGKVSPLLFRTFRSEKDADDYGRVQEKFFFFPLRLSDVSFCQIRDALHKVHLILFAGMFVDTVLDMTRERIIDFILS